MSFLRVCTGVARFALRLGAAAALSLSLSTFGGVSEFIVRYKPGVTIAQREQLSWVAKLRTKRQVRTAAMKRAGHGGLALVQSDLNPKTALALLRKDPAVAYAEPNYTLRAAEVSNDPVFTSGNLWGMYGDLSTPANSYGSQAAEAWSAGYTGSSSVYVAVIDDGMQITHTELAPNVWTNPFDPADGIDNDGNGFVDDINGWNFAATNNVVFESGNGHGTHVAGIIGARGGDGAGVAGVNWNVTLIPVKFLSNGSGSTLNAVEAIDYCIDLKTRHGINLVAINASWGGTDYSISLHDAMIRAANAGILFIAAAGNDGVDTDTTAFWPANTDTSVGTIDVNPAAFNNVLSVAAIDSSGALATFSNYGARHVHLGAPGVAIFSTYPVDQIGGLSGTSMAAPHVTGAIALYASSHPSASPAQIRAAILNSVTPTASLSGKTITGGRLNLSTVIAPAPSVEAVSVELIAEQWPNGVIDPGENVTVRLTVTNASPVATTALAGTLSASTYVQSPSASQAFGSLVAGGASVSRDFSFSAAGTCGKSLPMTLTFTDGAQSLPSLSFSLPLGTGLTSFIEDFDSVTAPALPAGWSVTLSGAGAQWKTVTGFASSGSTAIFAPNPSGVADNRLTSPVISITSASALLTFRHSFDFENDWDGGVLEISINNGAYTDIVTAGGVFLEDGYNWRLNSAATLPSREAWSGRSGGFITTAVILPAACMNQNIRLRWRCVSDVTIGGTGWYLDSVVVADGSVCALADRTMYEDESLANLPVPIGDAASEPQVALSASASNASLLSSAGITLGGSGSARTLGLQPNVDATGSSTVTLKVQSSVATSYRTFNLTVLPVNDPPDFMPGPDIIAAQDGGSQVVGQWATGFSAGPADESGQSLTFQTTVDHAYLFASLPEIDGSGNLSFTPVQHQRGSALVTVQLHDDGGTDHSGIDVSSVKSFTLTIGQSMDSDSDGIPDDFETAFGLATNDTADASLDADGDGKTNYEEFLAGTDPSDPRSVLRLGSSVDASLVSPITYSSILGRVYSVEENSSFPSGGWNAVGSRAGTGGVLSETDSSATSDSRRVYRVRTTGENGDSVSSEYAGFCRLNLLGNSDTVVSIPFTRPVAERGAVQTVSASSVQFRGNPDWAPDQWVYASGSQSNTYYLLIRSGLLEGDYFTITANSPNSVSLDADDQTLASLAAGDAVSIVPYWTIGTVFPGGQAVHESPAPSDRLSEILVPDVQGQGTNLSSAATYYFWQGAWRRVGYGSGARNDDVLLPDMYVIARHNIATATTLTTEGAVMPRKLRVHIRRNQTGKQDNIIALCRPALVSLEDSGLLDGAAPAFRASLSTVSRGDELFLFDNAQTARNKSATKAYYYWNNAWRRVGAGALDAGAEVPFAPGTGAILRSDSSPAPGIWENSPGY